MTSETDVMESNEELEETTSHPNRPKTAPARKKRKDSAAELKRQLAAMKRSMAEKDGIIQAQKEQMADLPLSASGPLNSRWTGVFTDEGLVYYLDGDAETGLASVAAVDQEDGEMLYQASAKIPGRGPKVAYFGEIEDAAEIAENWTSRPGRRAIDTPVALRDIHESQEHLPDQGPAREIRGEGLAQDAIDAPEPIESNPRRYSNDKLKMLAFMEEEVTVRMAESTNPNDPPVIGPIINGGVRQYFLRGVDQEVKRKFVEVLARAKGTRFIQEPIQDGLGVTGYRMVPQTAPLYPYAVVDDRNPEGRAWLQAIEEERG